MDPDNPTCPPNPNWSTEGEMRLTVRAVDGRRVLVAEGLIDPGLPARLETALRDESVTEIWLRSAGGDAVAGNMAGRLLRRNHVSARIPDGWACAGACAFAFMGGIARTVEPGGLFIVQMFTHTNDREAIRRRLAEGEQATEDMLDTIARQSAEIATMDNTYVTVMGISRSLLTDIVYRQSAVPRANDRSTRRCLTRAELTRYNVAPQTFTR